MLVGLCWSVRGPFVAFVYVMDKARYSTNPFQINIDFKTHLNEKKEGNSVTQVET